MDGSIIRQATFGINFLTIGLFLLVLLFIALVNSKIDAVSNEIVTVGSVSLVGSTTESQVIFKQPKNTLLKSIKIVCTTTAIVAHAEDPDPNGDIGYKVGTSSGGAQIVAAITDQILDGGTTVPAGSLYNLTLLGTTASASSPAASPSYTSVERNVYFSITHTTAATAAGVFKFMVEYIAV